MTTTPRKPSTTYPARIRVETYATVQNLARKHRLSVVQTFEVLLAGWKLLLPAQQHEAMTLPDGAIQIKRGRPRKNAA